MGESLRQLLLGGSGASGGCMCMAPEETPSGEQTQSRKAPPVFAFISNRGLFFFPFPFIQSSHVYMSLFKLTSTLFE